MSANENSIAALAEHGAATQFGGERANLQAQQMGIKPGSIRANIRHLVKMGQLSVEEKTKKFILTLPKGATPAQHLAATAILDGLNAKSGNTRLRAIEFLTDQVDGKLLQPNFTADLEKFENMTEEELHAYNAELDRRIAAATAAINGSQQTTGGDDAGGNDAGEGSGDTAAREAGGAEEGSAAPIVDAPQ